ncbi:EpsI family protein [Thermosulfurimonas sp. F29]|nr:EpsI family protein [Thermosulfurimonas sp. F29]
MLIKSPSNNYCLLIPFIFLYMCWEKKKVFDFSEFNPSYSGIFLLLVSSVFSLIGQLSSIETFLYFGLYLAIISLFLVLYGKKCKYLIFPFLVLFFSIPLPPFINRLLTFNLQLATSVLAEHIIRMFNMSVFREGNILDIGITRLQVAEACSGLRYFMPLILLSLLIGYYGLNTFLSRLVLFFFVLPVSILFNAFRISVIALFYNYSLKLWLREPYHSILGWLFFVLAVICFLFLLLLLRALENRLSISVKDKQSLSACIPSKPKRGFKFDLFLTVVIFCVLNIFVGLILWKLPGIDRVPPKKDLLAFPLKLNGCLGESIALSPNILKSLWADDYFYGIYHCNNTTGEIHLLISYYTYQTTRHTAHTPHSCLLGSGWDILKIKDRLLYLSNHQKIVVRYMWLKKGEYKLLATYFYFERGRILISPWKHKLYLLWDALSRHRTDGALVRIELYLSPQLSYSEAEKTLAKFIRLIWPELEKAIPQ